MGKVVLVCGSRAPDFSEETVWEILDNLQEQYGFETLIHGDAPGDENVDKWAGRWGDERGLIVHPRPANWRKYGKRAGPIRNGRMLAEFRPDLVVAFPGDKGTADMVKKAKKADVAVLELDFV